MTPDDRQAPRFEPPPWEVEAFERFRSEQARARAAAELEDAFQQAKAPPQMPPGAITADGGDQSSLAGESSPPLSEAVYGETPGSGPVPEARIDAMLAELRAQEAPGPRASQTLVYGSAAFLGTLGVFMVIFAITMYSRANPSGGPAMMLAAMTSLIMLLAAAGCIAGAVVLYRKHHQ